MEHSEGEEGRVTDAGGKRERERKKDDGRRRRKKDETWTKRSVEGQQNYQITKERFKRKFASERERRRNKLSVMKRERGETPERS